MTRWALHVASTDLLGDAHSPRTGRRRDYPQQVALVCAVLVHVVSSAPVDSLEGMMAGGTGLTFMAFMSVKRWHFWVLCAASYAVTPRQGLGFLRKKLAGRPRATSLQE
jgi:hypothetical protein